MLFIWKLMIIIKTISMKVRINLIISGRLYEKVNKDYTISPQRKIAVQKPFFLWGENSPDKLKCNCCRCKNLGFHAIFKQISNTTYLRAADLFSAQLLTQWHACSDWTCQGILWVWPAHALWPDLSFHPRRLQVEWFPAAWDTVTPEVTG